MCQHAAKREHVQAVGDKSLHGIYSELIMDEQSNLISCNDSDVALMQSSCASMIAGADHLSTDNWLETLSSVLTSKYYSPPALCDGPGAVCKQIFMQYYPTCTAQGMWNASEPATLESWQSTADMFVQECGVLESCDSICAETSSTRVNALPGWLSTDVHVSNGKGRRADESCCCFGGGTAGCSRCLRMCDELFTSSDAEAAAGTNKDLDACRMKCENSGACDYMTDIDPQLACDGIDIDGQWQPLPELRQGATDESRCLAKTDKVRPVQCYFDEDTRECTEISECQVCQANVGADGSGNPVPYLALMFNLACQCTCGDEEACDHCSITGCPLDEESPIAGTKQVCAADGVCRGTWQNCWYRCETEESFLQVCARELASSRPEGFDEAACDVNLCKQNCDCVKGKFAADDVRFDLSDPFEEEITPWTSKLCRSVCPLVSCNEGDSCSEVSRQCESKMGAALEM
jgi:hypothetical protein